MNKTVCIIIMKEDKILSVSRKDDHTDFGLPGGKVEDTDSTIDLAMIRELKEETGLDACNLKLVDVREWGGYLQHCFVGEARGLMKTSQQLKNSGENHLIKWCSPQEVISGSFGEYNKMIFDKISLI